MNELQRMCADVRPPRERAVAEGRARLLSAARNATPAPRAARRRMPRVGVRLVAVGALAVAIATGTTVVQSMSGTDEHGRPRPIVPGLPAGPVANAADLLHRAAVQADARPRFAPRPDQWIFIEHRQRFPAIGTRTRTPRTPLVEQMTRTWWRADGNQKATTSRGRYNTKGLEVENGPAGWKHHYPTLAALPTDPARLPDAMVAKGLAPHLAGLRGEERAAELYGTYLAILRNGVAPPKLEAAIFRAIAALPGVTLDREGVDLAGRRAITVGRVSEGYLRTEVMIDPATYAYLGERVTAIRDHTSEATDGTWTVKKGAVLNLETRTPAGRVVDRPGLLP
ncbi:MAG TPA: CU044_5270 family protein [Thermomonospora sp.]|nr:CU044_5270 family protein [Thermomonospora sp.]